LEAQQQIVGLPLLYASRFLGNGYIGSFLANPELYFLVSPRQCVQRMSN
jgi:hypothetical protein